MRRPVPLTPNKMALEEYRRKRDFEKTPEPAPKPVPKAKKSELPQFFIQRHDATRLHYDFRLEIGGVLVSWAVPKGPSLEPLAKHLAMHVEDHPFDYGTFEGNIPKGEYGGGSVMLWDRGRYELLGDAPAQEQIARGDLKFRLHGEKVKGEFALVHMRGRGKGNEWLLIKKKDAEARPGWNVEDYAYSVLTGRTQQEIAENLPAVKKPRKTRASKSKDAGSKKNFEPTSVKGAVRAEVPSQITPMLACLAGKPPQGEDWLYEIKWDGIRALCYIENGRVEIYSRNGNRCTQQYPELSVLPRYINASTAILDGEIAVLDEQGRPKFNLIQPRISVSDPNSIAHLSRSNPVTLFLFDVLYTDGYDLRAVPLIERKQILSGIVETTERVHLSNHFVAHGAEMLEAARQNGLEGIVAKRTDSKYESRRSPNWLKIKVVNEQEFVIGGFTHGERTYFSSLVLGIYDNGKLVHVGQVGTGFNERNMREIYNRLEPLITSKSLFSGGIRNRLGRDVTWVKPELVANIKYLEFTPDGLLRAPVFIGLRDDKPAREVVKQESAAATGEFIPKNSPNEVTVTVDGHALKFTNLNKIWFPKDGVKKRDVINYYDSVADLILPHLRDRPLSLKRYPNGIEQEFFFQKNAEDKAPDWVRLEPIDSEHRGAPIHFIIANDRATLLYLANLACIDQNPWMSRAGSLENPDFVLIDLDPQECSYDLIVEAAQLVRKKLDVIGLEGYPKTTGGDGIHIYIPLEPVYTYEQVRSFAEILSILVINEKPELFTTPRAVAKRRKGRVYFDYLQISSGKTIAGPYVLRAYPGAPVSTPLNWTEVRKGLDPKQFNIHNARERFGNVGDLFAPVLTRKQRLEDALEKLSSLLEKTA